MATVDGPCPLLLVLCEEEEEKEEEEASTSSGGADTAMWSWTRSLSPWFGVRVFIGVMQEWPRWSSTVAVVRAWLVFLVLLALCSLFLSAGPCGPDSAESCAVLGPVVLARRCVTTGAGFSPDCAALPVEIPQVLFLDEVMVTATGAVVLCRSSAVAVHRWSSTSLSFRRCRSSWSRLFSRPQSFPSCCSMVDVPVMRACRFSGAAVEMSLALPQLQLAEKTVSFYDPSYFAVTCSVSPGEYKSWIFWEMSSGIIPVFSTLWFDSGYMLASVYEASGRISRIFYVLVDSGR